MTVAFKLWAIRVCDHIVRAENDYNLFREGEKHVFNAHGMKKQDFIPAFNEKMKSFIRES
jgi:hypothetical protein